MRPRAKLMRSTTCWPYTGLLRRALGGFRRRALKVERETRVILNAAGDPKAGSDLIANAAANGVALILRIREMTCGRYHRVVAEKEAARHGEPSIADGVGIAQETRKAANRATSSFASAP
jgi:hypothetical protein